MPDTKMGRPKADNPKSNMVSVRLTDSQMKDLQETANQMNLTQSETIVEALKQLHEKSSE